MPDLPKDWRCKGVAELLYSHLLLLTPLYDGGDDDSPAAEPDGPGGLALSPNLELVKSKKNSMFTVVA